MYEQEAKRSEVRKAVAEKLAKKVAKRLRKELPTRKVESRDDGGDRWRVSVSVFPKDRDHYSHVDLLVESHTSKEWRSFSEVPKRLRLKGEYGDGLSGSYKLDKAGDLPEAKLAKVVERVREFVERKTAEEDRRTAGKRNALSRLDKASESLVAAGYVAGEVYEGYGDAPSRTFRSSGDPGVEVRVEVAGGGQFKVSLRFERDEHWCSMSSLVAFANELVRHHEAMEALKDEDEEVY